MANAAWPINRSIFVPCLFVIRFVRIHCTACYQFRLIFPLQEKNWRKDRFELCEWQFDSFPLSIHIAPYAHYPFNGNSFSQHSTALFVFSRVDLPHTVNYRSLLFCTKLFQAIESNSPENGKRSINCYIFPKKKNVFKLVSLDELFVA